MKEKRDKTNYFMENLSRPITNLFLGFNKRLRFSITFKNTALYALNFFLSLLRMGTLLALCFILYLAYENYREFAHIGEIIQELLRENDTDVIPENDINNIARASNLYISIYRDKTIPVYSTTDIIGVKVADLQYWQSGLFEDKLPYALCIDLSYNVMAVRVESPEYTDLYPEENAVVESGAMQSASDANYAVVLYKSVEEEISAVQVFVVGMGILFMVSLWGTGRKGSRQTSRMLRPIHDMTQAARSISYHELSTRLNPINTHDELKELAETFNEMLDRIQDSSIMQNRFVSDASHELRTPVTVIQGYANMLSRWGNDDKEVLDESITAIKGESESMKALLESLLFLTRAEKDTQKVEKSVFSLDELIDEVVRETRLIDNTHRITGFIEKGVGVNGDRGLIKQAVRIFVENSMKYTPAGGTIAISCYLELKDAKGGAKKREKSTRKTVNRPQAFLDRLRRAGFIVTFDNGLQIAYDKKDAKCKARTANPTGVQSKVGVAGTTVEERNQASSGVSGDEDSGVLGDESLKNSRFPRTHIIIDKKHDKIKPDAYQGRAVIVISDTGIGIAPNDIPHIFDRFYRCDESRTRESGGTGLGLSIAKWIVERHSGDITVESKVDRGTRITIRLPEWIIV